MLLTPLSPSDHLPDLIIPLPSDTAFFQLLASTLSSLSDHWDTLQDDFNSALATLAASISLTARPVSSSAPYSFPTFSITTGNSKSLRHRPGGKSDLYTWREIFRLYAETEVFESVKESARGERSIEEVEKQLKLFNGLVQEKKTSLVLPGSKDAFDVFLNLNLFILHVKKVHGFPSSFIAPAHALIHSSNLRIRKRLEKSSRSMPNVRRFRFRLISWDETRPDPPLPHVNSRCQPVLRNLYRSFSCKRSAKFFYPSYHTLTIMRALSVPLSHSSQSGFAAAISSA